MISSALHRDDFSSRGMTAGADHTKLPFDVSGKPILLIDDVLYTGRTIRAALDALFDHGRPKSVQLLVLIDRGHRELPIRADYVGKNIPTAADQSVRVRLDETDGDDAVLLVGTEAGAR